MIERERGGREGGREGGRGRERERGEDKRDACNIFADKFESMVLREEVKCGPEVEVEEEREKERKL